MNVFYIIRDISYSFARIVCYSFNKKVSLAQKYLHVQVAKEDPQARIVGGRAVPDG